MRSPRAALAVVSFNLTLVMAVNLARTSLAERPFAAPFPLPAAWWPPVVAALAAVAAVVVAMAVRDARAHRRGTWLLDVLLVPGVAVAWIAARPAATGPAATDGVALVVVGALVLVIARRTPPRPDSLASRRGLAALTAGRAWRVAHGVALVVLLGAAVATHAHPDGKALLVSLATYPWYALVQLALVLALPWSRLSALAGPRAAVVTCVVLFALMHWPNPALMGLTALGMALWALEYRRGRPLWALALSMSLLATIWAQLLPHDWTQHMRVGSGYTRVRAVPAVTARAATQATTDGTSTGTGWSTLTFVAALYPPVVGRPATAPELDRWLAVIRAATHGTLAWRFFISREYRIKFAGPRGEAPLSPDVHWTTLDPAWRARILRFASPAYADSTGGTWDGFLAGLYRDILHRRASPQEIARWPRTPPVPLQRQVTVTLFERRDALRSAPFDTLTAGQLLRHD